jgi:hypothetical protein
MMLKWLKTEYHRCQYRRMVAREKALWQQQINLRIAQENLAGEINYIILQRFKLRREADIYKDKHGLTLGPWI